MDTNKLIASEASSCVILSGGAKSRTLQELYDIIPEEHRRKILGAAGTGTSLCALLEYVVQYGESLTVNLREELESVKASFHQDTEIIHALNAELKQLRTYNENNPPQK